MPYEIPQHLGTRAHIWWILERTGGRTPEVLRNGWNSSEEHRCNGKSTRWSKDCSRKGTTLALQVFSQVWKCKKSLKVLKKRKKAAKKAKKIQEQAEAVNGGEAGPETKAKKRAAEEPVEEVEAEVAEKPKKKKKKKAKKVEETMEE